MRKNIECLCIALASAMMLGEAGTAMAASVENAADGAPVQVAEAQADVGDRCEHMVLGSFWTRR